MRQDRRAPTNTPPEAHPGVSGLVIPGSPPTQIGAICVQKPGDTLERWLVNDPVQLRNSGMVEMVYLSTDDDYLASGQTMGTFHSVQGISTGREAIPDAFHFSSLPAEGPGTSPPEGAALRFYALKTSFVGGEDPPFQSGALYREVVIGQNGQEQWSDHWVLFPSYTEPAFADEGNEILEQHVQIARLFDNVPTSLDDFIDQMNTLAQYVPGTYLYAHVAMSWTTPS